MIFKRLFFSNIKDKLLFDWNEEVIEYICNKIQDNLEHFTDFAIVKQSAQLLKKFYKGIEFHAKELKGKSEVYLRLQNTIEEFLSEFPISDEENDESLTA